MDANSELGKQIAGSKFGLVIHSSVAEPGADIEPMRSRVLADTDGLFVADPNLKDTTAGVTLNADQVTKLKQLKSQSGSQIDSLFNPSELRDRRISGFPKLFKQYINTKVRAGNYNNMIKDFIPFMEQKVTPQQAMRIREWMMQNQEGTVALVQSFLLISNLKNDLVRQLDQGAHDIEASIDNEPGHEGYVGSDLKFVDRMRFSQANFAKNNPEL